MDSRRHEIIETCFVLLLIVGVFLVTVTDGAAAPIKTNVPVETRVKNARETCGDLGGTFTTGSWTTLGEQPGTTVTTTFTQCDTDGDSSVCYNTVDTIDCGPFIRADQNDRGATDQSTDAVQDDPGSPFTIQPPAVTPPVTARD